MEVKFSKMAASGNDFILIDNRGAVLGGAEKELAKKLCRRKFSVGADGLILIEKSERADFQMRIINPDGSEAEMCGNGARCAALYAGEKFIAPAKMNFETLSGLIFAEISDSGVRVNIGKAEEVSLNKEIGADGHRVKAHYLKVGVPHAVIIEKRIGEYPVLDMGSKIRFSRDLQPQGANVDFIEITDEETILMRTYERGVEGETLACGTGAAASALVAHLVKGLNPKVKVVTRGGETLTVTIEKKEDDYQLILEGSTALVYDGTINI